ncbi:MAG: hypothetical protein JSU65_09600 [Candidatus Zixiibacteriota bacterium]|nr:MAG: hypothetical protein JSU65_09600 [candidate division Zixibacteria bacterium]
MRRKFPQLVCGLIGLLLFVVYFSRHPIASSINETVTREYWQIVFAFALLVGVVSFAKINLQGIERGEDRLYRIISLVGLISMPVLALIWGIGTGSPFMWVFDNVQVPMQSTVFALLAFFVASASLRGFRARSGPAFILLLAAMVALISRSDVGDLMSARFSDFAEWIRSNPSMSARRAILIGIGLGSLTTSLRVLLGLERTWLGKESK